MKFEEILDQIGSYGWFQKKLVCLIFFASLPNAFVTLHFVITHYTPDFHCKLPAALEKELQNSTNYEELLNLTIPFETDNFGNIRRSQCRMYKRNYSQLFEPELENVNGSFPTTHCKYGWHYYIDQESVVSEFDLVCSDSWKTNLVVSVVMAAKAVAAVAGFLADRYGRRPVFLVTTFMQLAGFATSSFSFSFTFYVICMFVTGLASVVNFICAFVLATELTDISKRNFIAFSAFFAYSIGFIGNAGLGYLFPKWSSFILAASVISCYQIIFYWIFPESARWLIQAGKIDEAKRQVSIIAKNNGKSIDVEELFNKIQEENSKQEEVKSQPKSNIFKLFKSPARGRFFSIYFGWLCTSLIYYAVSIFSREFSGDRILNGLFAAIADLCGCLVAYFLNFLLGRPRTMCLCMLVTGVSSFLVVVLPRDLTVTISLVALAGKCMITGEFLIVYAISAELAPTLERNSSLSFSSLCARVGGVLAPYIMLLDRVQFFLPYILMAVFALISGILAIVYIPETKGVPLPETITDVESNQRYYGWKIWKSKAEDKGENAISDKVEE